MDKNPVIYATLETDMIDGGGLGGLGGLTSDVFYEARRRNLPFYMFAPVYPMKTHQTITKANNGYSVATDAIPASNDSLRKNQVDRLSLGTKWYPFDVSVYLDPLSTENTQAYFFEIIPKSKRGRCQGRIDMAHAYVGKAWPQKIRQVQLQIIDGGQVFGMDEIRRRRIVHRFWQSPCG
ncbi:MAG: hypothetical protein V1836_00620 [Candidatus Aenigmatarchaeota archaeon]